MPRDKALEALLTDDLGTLPGLTQKSMFGGLAWLLHGRLLCGASSRGLMLRLDPQEEASALATQGISRVVMKGREMPGWLRLTPEAYANDELRQALLAAALRHIRSLPPR